MKPGCYGSTIAIYPNEEPCASCPFFEGFKAHVLHLEARVLERTFELDGKAGEAGSKYNRMKVWFGKRWSEPKEESEPSTELNKREQELFNKIDGKLDYSVLASGQNPAEGIVLPPYVHDVLHYALELRAFRPSDLLNCVVERDFKHMNTVEKKEQKKRLAKQIYAIVNMHKKLGVFKKVKGTILEIDYAAITNR
jgi:hypothetical protein